MPLDLRDPCHFTCARHTGWGTDEHEGFADEKRPDGSWSGGSTRSGDPDADARRPRLLQRRALGQGSASEVEFEHRAFLHWPATGLTVVPTERWNEQADIVDLGFHSEAVAFRVAADGIAPIGRIEHPGGTWQSRIARSVVVGNRLFTVSEAGVLASPIAAPGGGAWLPF